MLNLSTIRAAARAGRINWRYHALLRAYQRGITREQALQVINTGEIIEQRLRARRFPKCLLMATVEPDRPLYVSVGYDPEPRGARAQEAPGSILRGSAIFDSPPQTGFPRPLV